MADVSADLLPISLDPSTTTSFEIEGHTYRVEFGAKLSLIRDRWLEKFSLLASSGRDAKAFMAEVRRAYESLNQNKTADAAVALDNLLKGLADVQSRETPMLYICTLFINREDEDRAGYDLEFAKDKIKAWGRIESFFFMYWALNFLRITDEHLEMFTQISLGQSLPKLNLNDQ